MVSSRRKSIRNIRGIRSIRSHLPLNPLTSFAVDFGGSLPAHLGKSLHTLHDWLEFLAVVLVSLEVVVIVVFSSQEALWLKESHELFEDILCSLDCG